MPASLARSRDIGHLRGLLVGVNQSFCRACKKLLTRCLRVDSTGQVYRHRLHPPDPERGERLDALLWSHSNGAFPGVSWFTATSSTHRFSAASLDASGVGPRPTASRLPSNTLVSYARVHNDSLSSHVRRMREVLISVPIPESSHRDVA